MIFLFLLLQHYFIQCYGVFTTLSIPSSDVFGIGTLEFGAAAFRIQDNRGYFSFPLEDSDETRQKMLNGTEFFSLGVYPQTQEEIDAGILAIPIIVSGVCVVFNLGPQYTLPLPPFDDLEQTNNVLLGFQELSAIFGGHVTRWRDPKILTVGQQSDVVNNMPDINMTVFLPSRRSSVIYRFTEALDQYGTGLYHLGTSYQPAWNISGARYVDVGDNNHDALWDLVQATPGSIAVVPIGTPLGKDASMAGMFTNSIFPNPIFPSLLATGWTPTVFDASVNGHERVFADPSASMAGIGGSFPWPLTTGILAYIAPPPLEPSGELCLQYDVLLNFLRFLMSSRALAEGNSAPFGYQMSDVTSSAFRRASELRCAGSSFDTQLAMATGGLGRLFVNTGRQGTDVGEDFQTFEISRQQGISQFAGGRGTQVLFTGVVPERENRTQADTVSVPVGHAPVGIMAVLPELEAAGVPGDQYPVFNMTIINRLFSEWVNGQNSITWGDPMILELNNRTTIPGLGVTVAELLNRNRTVTVWYHGGRTGFKTTMIAAMRRADPNFWDGVLPEPPAGEDDNGYDVVDSFAGGGLTLEFFPPQGASGLSFVTPENFLLSALAEFLPGSIVFDYSGALSTLSRLDFSLPPFPLLRIMSQDGSRITSAASHVDVGRAVDEALADPASRAVLVPRTGRVVREMTNTQTGYPMTALVWATLPRRLESETLAPQMRLAGSFVYQGVTDERALAVQQLAGFANLRPAQRRAAYRGLFAMASLFPEGNCLTADGTVCSDRGSCIGGTCVCDDGYEGDQCQDKSDSGGLSETVRNVIIGLASGVGGLLLLVVFVCCGLCCLLCLLALLFAVVVVLVVVIIVIVIVVVVVVIVCVAIVVIVAMSAVAAGKAGMAYLRREKQKIEASYDLTVFEGYEGEKVADGLERKFRELKFDDLTFEEKIGEGAFGKVFLGRWREATVVAIKELNVRADEKAKREFVNEANVMAMLGNHPNVVHFIGAITTEERFYMVSEFATYGSLLDFLKSDHEMLDDDDFILNMCAEAAAGLVHLHAEGVVHRDIACRNFLVGSDLKVQVTDFGMSRILTEESEDANRTQSNLGPVRWMAPESITRREYSTASDVYMFGSFLYEFITREIPYSGTPVQDVITLVTKRKVRPTIPNTCPTVLAEAMRLCWHQSPKKRPTMADVYRKLSSSGHSLEYAAGAQSETTASWAGGAHKNSRSKPGNSRANLNRSSDAKSTVSNNYAAMSESGGGNYAAMSEAGGGNYAIMDDKSDAPAAAAGENYAVMDDEASAHGGNYAVMDDEEYYS